MNSEFFKKCEVCNKDIFIYKGVENSVVGRDDIKVWHYDCRIKDSKYVDDLAVRVYKCTGPMAEDNIVISYMTPESVENIDNIYPNCFKSEIMSSIIRIPLLTLENSDRIKTIL